MLIKITSAERKRLIEYSESIKPAVIMALLSLTGRIIGENDTPITLQFRAIEGNILYEKDSRQVSDMGLTLILGELARRRFASYRKITTGPQPGPAGSSNLWCEDQIRIRTGRQITRLSASRHSTHRCTARRSPGCARFVPF